MRLHIIGEWLYSTSGYASHTHQLVKSLLQQENVDLSLDTIKPVDWVKYVSDKELKIYNKPYDESATIVMIAQPPFWNLALSENPKAFYGYVIWEGMYIPVYWLKHLSSPKVTGILVPSTHVKQAISNTIEYVQKKGLNGVLGGLDIDNIMKKVYIIPHGVDTTIFKPIPELKHEAFTFIVNKGFNPQQMTIDRGGVQYCIEAFLKEFKFEEPVQMIIKINTSYGTPNIDNFLQQKGLTANTNLMFTFDMVDFKLLPKLYNRGHCFVSATRCDAWNLPGLEAMACGLPTLQTNFGGQTDYMTENNSWFLPYNLEEINYPHLNFIPYEGNFWATPSIDVLRKQMRYLFEHQDEVKKKGEQALKDAQKWTWDKSTKKLLNILT